MRIEQLLQQLQNNPASFNPVLPENIKLPTSEEIHEGLTSGLEQFALPQGSPSSNVQPFPDPAAPYSVAGNPFFDQLPQDEVPPRTEGPATKRLKKEIKNLENEQKSSLESRTTIPSGGEQLPSAETQSQEQNRLKLLMDKYRQLLDAPEEDDKELEQARESQKQYALMQGLLEAGALFGTGHAGGSKVPQISDAYTRLGNLEVEGAQEKSKLKKERNQRQLEKVQAGFKLLDMESEAKFHDPNSVESQFYQQTLQQIYPDSKNIPALRTASAATIQKLFPLVQTKIANDMRKQEMENARNDRKDKWEQIAEQHREKMEQRQNEERRRKNDLFSKFADRMEKDTQFKELQKQGIAFSQIQPLIKAAEDGNEAAVASLGTKLARAMGEVGVLTDQDVVRYLGNVSYGRKVSSWLERGMQGELPKPAAKDIKALVNMMQDVHKNKVLPIYNKYANIMVNNFPGEITEDEALARLGAPGYTKDFLSSGSSNVEFKPPLIDEFEDIK